MSNSVRDKLEEYFASLNSTSRRMITDVINSRQEYHDKWENLTPDEQSQILWSAIVKPEAVSKYKDLPAKSLDVEYFPVLRTKPGEKIIVDEDTASAKSFGSTWQDEHSAPFRWETQSQLELRMYDDDTEQNPMKAEESVTATPKSTPISTPKSTPISTPTSIRRSTPKPTPKHDTEKSETKKEEEVKRHTVKRPEVPPPPVPPHTSPPVPPHSESPPVPAHNENGEKSDAPIYAKVVKRKSSAKTLLISELKAHRKAKEEMKPAVPPRMSLELKGDMDISKYTVQDIDIDGIPKTGFDFLDNW